MRPVAWLFIPLVAAELILFTGLVVEDFYFDDYPWRLDFFTIQAERPEDRRQIWSPEDYLLAYWLGRYHGIIAPDW